MATLIPATSDVLSQDSLVSNVVNIWIIEKDHCPRNPPVSKETALTYSRHIQAPICQEELKADRSAASQLVPYIQDERRVCAEDCVKSCHCCQIV